MNKVICDAIGIHEECVNCGASKPHDPSECEPCLLIAEARCNPVIANTNTKCVCYHCKKQPLCSHQGMHVKQCANYEGLKQ